MDFTRIFIGGEWRTGGAGLTASIDPSDGSLVAEYGTASVADVDAAVKAGHRAVADPAWRAMLPHDRARILHRIGDAIEREAEAFALLQTRDTGKTLAETSALAKSAAGTFRYVAAALETTDDTLTSPRGPYLTMSFHEPIGVIAAITPWNSPIASDAQKIAPALAAGNAVVLKPAEWTSLVSLKLAALIEEQGLPKGLLSVLPGPGAIIGSALVRHPGVGKVVFTGGTTTGRTIAAAAAERLIPVSLELGGKSPTIVFADADLDLAIAGVMFGIFSSSGQSCIAGSRLFVHRSIAAPFVERLVQATQALRIGPGTDPATQVAPLVSHPHRDKVAGMVTEAVHSGAQLLCGGQAPADAGFAAGAYYQPTILTGVPNEAAICQQEIFGPVLAVLPFEDEADLIYQTNDTVYGLACGIWTRDFPKAYRIARAIDCGTVWINTFKQFSVSTPFGGTKESGLGREKGRDWIREYTKQKSVYVGLSEEPLPWSKSHEGTAPHADQQN